MVHRFYEGAAAQRRARELEREGRLPRPPLTTLMHRAQAAQQAHAQKHDVQLAIVALVAQHPDKEAP